MARMYYSKDVPKYQYVDVKYVPTNEKGHTLQTCARHQYLYLTKLEIEAFIHQCKRIVASKFSKNHLVYKLETLNINGEPTRFMRIGFKPAEPESVEQFKMIISNGRPTFTNWDKESLVYLSHRDYTFL
jgi:hypothetical protein